MVFSRQTEYQAMSKEPFIRIVICMKFHSLRGMECCPQLRPCCLLYMVKIHTRYIPETMSAEQLPTSDSLLNNIFDVDFYDIMDAGLHCSTRHWPYRRHYEYMHVLTICLNPWGRRYWGLWPQGAAIFLNENVKIV